MVGGRRGHGEGSIEQGFQGGAGNGSRINSRILRHLVTSWPINLGVVSKFLRPSLPPLPRLIQLAQQKSQRAMIAARMANMPAHRPDKSADLRTYVSQPEAAELFGGIPEYPQAIRADSRGILLDRAGDDRGEDGEHAPRRTDGLGTFGRFAEFAECDFTA